MAAKGMPIQPMTGYDRCSRSMGVSGSMSWTDFKMSSALTGRTRSFEDITIYPHYSGRGMYGSTCFGIVAENPITAVIKITRGFMEDFAMDDEILDALEYGACMGGMGLSSIIYWPHIRCAMTDDEDDT